MSLSCVLVFSPDQDVDILPSCMSEVVQEMALSVHVVSFDSCSPAAVVSIKLFNRPVFTFQRADYHHRYYF